MPMATSQIEQEAKNFIGKKGPNYVLHMATKEEKEYFEGIIYKKANKIRKIGTIWILKSMLNISMRTGIIIVNATNKSSILNPLFFNCVWFLFKNTANIYCNKFIVFELIILYILVSISPAKAENETVSNSGIDVATPAIFPIVFEDKFKFNAKALSNLTNTYLEIITITIEYIKNFNIPINM